MTHTERALQRASNELLNATRRRVHHPSMLNAIRADAAERHYRAAWVALRVSEGTYRGRFSEGAR